MELALREAALRPPVAWPEPAQVLRQVPELASVLETAPEWGLEQPPVRVPGSTPPAPAAQRLPRRR